jgi:hypothetical protein
MSKIFINYRKLEFKHGTDSPPGTPERTKLTDTLIMDFYPLKL